MAAAPELEELELALNEVTPDGAKELAAALANKTKLQKLNLRENELEDRGVILLSGPIQSLPALRILDLAQNQVCFLQPLSQQAVSCDIPFVYMLHQLAAVCLFRGSKAVPIILFEGRHLCVHLLCQEWRIRGSVKVTLPPATLYAPSLLHSSQDIVRSKLLLQPQEAHTAFREVISM